MSLGNLVDAVSATGEKVVITTNGIPAAVLISPDEFESWRETVAVRQAVAPRPLPPAHAPEPVQEARHVAGQVDLDDPVEIADAVRRPMHVAGCARAVCAMSGRGAAVHRRHRHITRSARAGAAGRGAT